MTRSIGAYRWLLPLALLLNVCEPRASEAQALASLEVSGGYVYLRDPVNDVNFSAGWMAGAAAGVNRWLAGVFEVAGSHRSADTIVGDIAFDIRSYMAGVRASARVGPATEFARVLVGALHGTGTILGETDSTTNIALQLGGGFDVPLCRALAFRGQADVRVIPSSPKVPHEFFFGASLVYRFF
jgi:hypothetical protein